MASGGKRPPDKLGEKTFKCHPKVKVSFVVCLICESVYHNSDFEKLKNIKYISETLVICPEHPNIDLTTKNMNRH